jgi:serine/threonine protein kinase
LSGFSAAHQELASLQRVKTIRHPFLLSMERVEVIDNVLLIVMELADKNLHTVLLNYQVQGQVGVPREQLLCYLFEAAEALDVINFEHGLQHLDIKPHNLFVVGNHIKVADFGLVHSLFGTATHSSQRRGGLTPLYAAPELYQQSLSRHSDQYSLAIVYQQLLTATVPFASPNIQELMRQHMKEKPDLSALPVADQAIVGRALSKNPEKRYPSCLEFMQALLAASSTPLPRSSLVGQRLTTRPGNRPSGSSAQVPIIRPPVDASKRGSGSHRRLAANEATVPTPSQAVSPAATNWATVRKELSARVEALARSQPASVLPADRSELPRPIPPTNLSGVASNTPLAPQATCVTVSGYVFQECCGQTPLGEIWKLVDPQGKQRRGYSLISGPGDQARLFSRFQAFKHPTLPDTEVIWSPTGRLVLVTDLERNSLRDRFAECAAQKLPGIPRTEMLGYLRIAAEALDTLARDQGLPHLGLNPGNLLVDSMKLWIADYGVVPLVWLPIGQPAGQLNSRYAAPELFTSTPTASSDQYSLAMIFAEMLTGVYPRLNQPSSRSDTHRRQASVPGRGSQQVKTLDLDFLTPNDRQVIARALHEDPAERFASCTALVDALEEATPKLPPVEEQPYTSLPLVMPYDTLIGKAPKEDVAFPVVGDLLTQVVASAAGPITILHFDNTRYLLHPDGCWEYRCPIQTFGAGLLRMKLEGFCRHWNATPMSEDEASFVCQIQKGTERRGLFRKPLPTGLTIHLMVCPVQMEQVGQREVVVRIQWFGELTAEAHHLTRDMAPRLFQSIRAYLQASPEQRSQERWPFIQPVRLYPVLRNLELAGVLEARCRNISLGGLSVVTSKRPQSDFVYLHLYDTPHVAKLAILSRVLRVQEWADGQFEVGVTFQVDGPPPDDQATPIINWK